MLHVNYLGHVISLDGVVVDPIKIQSVLDWPTPSNARGVCGFLGLAGYYRKFIRRFVVIATPLTYLLTREAFCWTLEAEVAFHHMRIALMSPFVLQLSDFSIPFVVECDASGLGFGAILTQHNRPIAFYSEALKGSALALSAYEKEMLAIMKAIHKWCPYLLGRPFIIQTDQ